MCLVINSDMQWSVHTTHRQFNTHNCLLLSELHVPILLNSIDNGFFLCQCVGRKDEGCPAKNQTDARPQNIIPVVKWRSMKCWKQEVDSINCWEVTAIQTRCIFIIYQWGNFRGIYFNIFIANVKTIKVKYSLEVLSSKVTKIPSHSLQQAAPCISECAPIGDTEDNAPLFSFWRSHYSLHCAHQ